MQTTVVINEYRLLYNSINSTQWYVVMSHQTLYFLQMVIPVLLFANKERASTERRMECGITDETPIPPLKCECFGSAALGQSPS